MSHNYIAVYDTLTEKSTSCIYWTYSVYITQFQNNRKQGLVSDVFRSLDAQCSLHTLIKCGVAFTPDVLPPSYKHVQLKNTVRNVAKQHIIAGHVFFYNKGAYSVHTLVISHHLLWSV